MSATSGPGATTPRSSRGAAFGDFDNDGDQDVLVMNMNEPPSLLRNDLGGGNGWLQVRLEGTASNRMGLGATVRVTAGGRTQARAVLSQSSYYSHDDLRVPFGLGRAASGRAHRGAVAERPAGRRDRTCRPTSVVDDSRGSGAGLATAAARTPAQLIEIDLDASTNWLLASHPVERPLTPGWLPGPAVDRASGRPPPMARPRP